MSRASGHAEACSEEAPCVPCQETIVCKKCMVRCMVCDGITPARFRELHRGTGIISMMVHSVRNAQNNFLCEHCDSTLVNLYDIETEDEESDDDGTEGADQEDGGIDTEEAEEAVDGIETEEAVGIEDPTVTTVRVPFTPDMRGPGSHDDEDGDHDGPKDKRLRTEETCEEEACEKCNQVDWYCWCTQNRFGSLQQASDGSWTCFAASQ